MAKINNLSNTADIFRYVVNKFPYFKSKNIENDTDLNLIYQIQPVSGIKFHENFWALGDGYMTCIHIYAAPESISRHWLYDLFKLKNVITTVDIRPMKITEAKGSINESVKEHTSRRNDARDILEVQDAQKSLTKLIDLLDEISNLGNIILAVDLRVYVTGRSFYEMEKNVESVEQSLTEDGFAEFGRNLNEQAEEYLSLFYPSDFIQKTLSARSGLPVPANIMAQSLPFYNVGWQDVNGYYLGDTETATGRNCVLFNPFYIDQYRTCYDGFICGAKGTGKSTTLKRMIEQAIAIGNRVRIIDVTGEFTNVVRNLQGVIIKFDGDGKSGILNLLEILRMDESDTQNYIKHVSKMSLIYRLMSPDCSEQEVNLFKTILKKLYVEFGIIKSEDDTVYENITELDSNMYPTFSDLLTLINKEITSLSQDSSLESDYTVNILCSIRLVIEGIVKSYGALFDGHTSIPNVVNADVISYDISDIADMEPSVFDMQLFNVLSMAYDSCMTIGTNMKSLHDNGKIKFEDIIHHLIIVDECQKSINVNKLFAIRRMLDIMRQDRKYFIGVWLATQNIADAYRDGNDTATKDMRTLFELCQYKMFFRQESSSIPDIQNAFSNILTTTQISQIPMLEKKEMLLTLSSFQTIRLKCKEISKSKLAYYGGGA